ncbi:MAG: hypothetical protein ACJ749_05315 [Flavisolibacter sp.]
MKATILFLTLAMLFAGCSRKAESMIDKGLSTNNFSGFTRYTIQQGNQYCDESGYAMVETNEMKFIVKFDSSAIYETMHPENQNDINKLFGFSDNNTDHHQFSARIGWRWSDDALRLFAYVYNNGTRVSKELLTVRLGDEINCSIEVNRGSYVFHVNGITAQMPRLATTEKAKGYQLYPFFGGDESAPHQVNIWIKRVE